MAYQFGGKTIELPGVYTYNDVSAFEVRESAVDASVVAVIGPAKGGVPNQVYRFTSPGQAFKTLKGGELYELINYVYRGGTPQQVVAIKVAGAGAAQASFSAGTLVLTSKDYGSVGNLLQAEVGNGSTVGKKITIIDGFSQYVETYDNLGPALNITYNGTGTTSTLTITVAAGSATTLSVTTLDASSNVIPEDTFTLDLTSSEYSTIEKVINAINLRPNFTAVKSTYMLYDDLPSSYLDAVTDQDITSTFTITATLGACIHTINKNSSLVTASKTDPNDTAAPTNTPLSFFTGGADGAAPTVTEYTSALALLEAEDVHYICVASGDGDVQGAVLAHVEAMSDVVNRMERMAFLGHSNPDATVSDYQAAALPFNASYRVVYCAPGIIENYGGTTVKRPSYYLAALLAGMKAGLRPQENITNKSINVVNLTTRFSPTEQVALLKSGVTPVAYRTNKGFYVVKGVTTYRATNNLAYMDIAAVVTIDNISKTIRTTLESAYIGKPITTSTVNDIKLTVLGILEGFAGRGALVGTENNPAYRNVQVVASGDVVQISFEASPALTSNYIFVTQVFTPAA
jgi:phage tail sheath gpL-like